MTVTSENLIFYVACAGFYALAIIFSFLINGLLLKFSKTLGDRRQQDRQVIRWTSQVKPSVGGFSFYILFLIALSVYGIFNFPGSQYFNEHLLGLVLTITMGFLIGLADDAYNTFPWLKFTGQLVCGFFLVATHTVIHITGSYVLDTLVTLTWVVGIMNSVNMLDNMDGVCGSVSMGILFAFLLALIAIDQLASVQMLMVLAVGGAVAGFLILNFYPAKIYMGDTGSQFLGVFLAAISIELLWNYHDTNGPAFQFRQCLIPLIAFSVPIIDTTTVFIRRIMRGQSPFVGGRDHVSHHFAYAGLNEKSVVYLLGGWSFLSAVLTVLLIRWHPFATSAVTLAFYGYFIILFLVVQYFYNVGKRKEQQQGHPSQHRKESIAIVE